MHTLACLLWALEKINVKKIYTWTEVEKVKSEVSSNLEFEKGCQVIFGAKRGFLMTAIEAYHKYYSTKFQSSPYIIGAYPTF